MEHSGFHHLSRPSVNVSRGAQYRGLRRCNSHCYELEGSTSCRRREKIQKAVLDASCKIWTVQQVLTHLVPSLANQSGKPVGPAVTQPVVQARGTYGSFRVS